MKKPLPQIAWAAGLATVAALVAPRAYAQSNMQFGGFISSGLNYATNVGGSHDTYMSPAGVFRPNTLFFKGAEDLGDRTKAIFLLSTMFSTANGSNTGGTGSMFSRESYAGLSNATWGTLTVGMHRDFMFDLSINGYSGAGFAGITGGHQGPFASFGVPWGAGGSSDFDRVNGEALTNSVKYSSANFDGLTFGAMYGFGGQAGHFGQDASQSLGANYSNGPVGVGASYTMTKYSTLNNGNDGIRNIGLGAAYRPAPFKFAALATWSRNTFSGAQIAAYDATIGYDFAAPITVNLTYTYMTGNAVFKNYSAQSLAAYISYNLSKRTSVYAEVIGQRAAGVGAKAQIYGTPGASSGTTQLVTTIGLQNVF